MAVPWRSRGGPGAERGGHHPGRAHVRQSGAPPVLGVQGIEEQVTGLREPAADHNGGHVEQRDGRDDAPAEHRPGPVERRLGDRIARSCVRRERPPVRGHVAGHRIIACSGQRPAGSPGRRDVAGRPIIACSGRRPARRDVASRRIAGCAGGRSARPRVAGPGCAAGCGRSRARVRGPRPPPSPLGDRNGSRVPAVCEGPAGHRGPPGDRLQAAPPPAPAQRPVRLDDDVTDVAGIAGGAVDHPVAQHDPAADAGGDHHAEHVGVPPSGAAPVLGHRGTDRVVVQAHRQPELGRQQRPQREVPPARHVHRRDHALGPAHRAAAADADAGHRHSGGAQHRLEQRQQRDPERAGIGLLRGGPDLGADHQPGRKHHRGGQLRAADVHREHRTGFRHGRTVRPRATGWVRPARPRRTVDG